MGPRLELHQPWAGLHTAQCGARHCAGGESAVNDGVVLLQTELNRVKGKPPYKELKGEGSLNAQADEAWDYAHSRSNSVIQDIFAGQLQSTLQCPACGALSHTFDEFMDLSLPLPQKAGLSVRSPTCTIQVRRSIPLTPPPPGGAPHPSIPISYQVIRWCLSTSLMAMKYASQRSRALFSRRFSCVLPVCTTGLMMQSAEPSGSETFFCCL